MTTEPDTPKPSPLPPKKRGRWWKIPLGFILVLLVLAGIAPTLASTKIGKNLLLGQLNRRIPGKVSLDSLTVAWFSGTSLRNFELRDSLGKTLVSMPTADTGMTLWSLLTGSAIDVGRLQVQVTEINLVTYADGTTNIQRALSSPSAPGTRSAPAPQATVPKAGKPTVARAESLEIAINRLTWESPNAPVLTIENALTKGSFDTERGAAEMTLGLQAQAGNGSPATLAFKGSGNFFENGQVRPLGTITGSGNAKLQSLDLAALSPILQAVGLQLHITGVVNAEMNLTQADGKPTLTASGQIDQLVVTGDLLKGDTLRLQKVTTAINAALAGETVDLKQLALVSDIASVDVTGSLKTSQTSSTAGFPPMTVTLMADVTALKQQLPQLLGSIPDTKVNASLTGQLDMAKKTLAVTSASKVSEKDEKVGLGTEIGLSPGCVFSWGNEPYNVMASVTYDLSRAQQILSKHLPEGAVLAGRRTVRLHVAGSLGQAAGLKMFRGFEIDPTSIGFDRVFIHGVEIGKADIGFAMTKGVLTITPTDVPANGGTFRLMGKVDFNADPPAYILEKQSPPAQIVKGWALDQQLAAGPLAFLPIAWGADKSGNIGQVSGQVNVQMVDMNLPLDAAALKSRGTASGTLNVSNLTTEAPFFSQLFNLLGPLVRVSQPDIFTIRGGSIPDVNFALANGKVSYQNLQLGTSKVNLMFSGAVGLDTSLEMTMEIRLLSLNIGMPLGLKGTTSKPELALTPGAVGQGMDKTIESIPNALDQFFKKKEK